MASTLLGPQNFIGENYDQALNASMQALLDSHTHDFSAFASNFYELMQARANPPLETIWVFSASTFRRSDSLKEEASDRVSAAKDLFQLVSGCSASCSSSKSIVLLAPVVYEICRVVVDLRGEDLGSKREKKLTREIKSLVNQILGNISVCCSANDDDGGDFNRPFEDLIRVWIGDGVDETVEANKVWQLFFPLLGDDIIGRLSIGGSSVSELAGVVIAEAFLLKLCLDFSWGDSKPELEKGLKNWAVGSVAAFHHFYFFDTLVRILLDQTFPANSLLSSEDEVSVRKVMYDAVILVEYSFLNLDKLNQQHAKCVKSLAIARVLVTHEATELFRRKGDQTKAISYISAFSGSQLPAQLVKAVTNEIGMGSKARQPKGFSPKALLKWLLNLEDQGFRLLDDGIAKYKSRLAFDISEDDERLAYTARGTNTNANLGFFIDNKGEGEEGTENEKKAKEDMNSAFVAAAHAMTSVENGGGRKRNGGRSGGKKKSIKFIKYDLCNDSVSLGEKSKKFLRNDESNSGSEVENPNSDEDIDEENEK